jgi:hypothetical protein
LSQTSKIPVVLPDDYFDFSSPTTTANGNNNSKTTENNNSKTTESNRITGSDFDPKEMDLVNSCIEILNQGKVKISERVSKIINLFSWT